MTTRKRMRKYYLIAAQNIADALYSDDPGCCRAIINSRPFRWDRYSTVLGAQKEFCYLFCPAESYSHLHFFGESFSQKEQEDRYLALLFMAEIAKDDY